MFITFYAGNLWLKRNLIRWDSSVELPKNGRLIFIITTVISFICASFIGDAVYSKLITAINPTWFNTADPIFGLNIGYYVFIRPLLVSLTDSVLGIAIFYTVYITLAYGIFYVRNGVRYPQEVLKQKGIVAHLITAVMFCVIIGAARFIFIAEDVLFLRRGEQNGGGFADVNIWLNFYRIIPFMMRLS